MNSNDDARRLAHQREERAATMPDCRTGPAGVGYPPSCMIEVTTRIIGVVHREVGVCASWLPSLRLWEGCLRIVVAVSPLIGVAVCASLLPSLRTWESSMRRAVPSLLNTREELYAQSSAVSSLAQGGALCAEQYRLSLYTQGSLPACYTVPIHPG